MLQQPPILSRQTSQQLHHSLIPHILRSNGNTRNTPLYGNAPFSRYSLSISHLPCTSPCNGCSRASLTKSFIARSARRAPGDPTRRERAPYHQTPQLGHELGRFLLAGPPPVLEEVHQLGWCTNMYLQTAKWVVHHAAKFVFV